MPAKTKTPTTECKQSDKVCQTHDTHLLEVWKNGNKIDEYCPVCYAEMQREFDSLDS